MEVRKTLNVMKILILGYESFVKIYPTSNYNIIINNSNSNRLPFSNHKSGILDSKF